MRNIGAILLVLGLMAVFMLPGLGRTPAEALLQVTVPATAHLDPLPNVTGTPRAVMPVFFVPPTNTATFTPSATPTPTRTPTPTNTPVPTATRTGVPGANELTGRLVFVEPKTDYFTHIEWIKFWLQIRNPTGQPISFTLLGVNVSGPDTPGRNARFHTSWTGAPDWILSGCWGPNGFTDWNRGPNYKCAPNENEGWHQDHVGDASNVELEEPGRYWIEFWACLSSHYQCTTPGQPATWRKLGNTLELLAKPPVTGHAVGQGPTPMPQTQCGLVTDDPDNVYLDCKAGVP